MLEHININAVSRTFPSHFNSHSYLASGALSRSHDKVGQGLIIFLPLAPGYGNDPHFLHALADVMMTSNVSSPAKG